MPDPIKATPTKEFFIHMLTRDVALVRAIIDLVDNSVDGAVRSRKKADSASWVHLTLGPELFRIEDNCGGIDVTTARDYAFRFGRPSDAPPTVDAIGLFGVGMKRTVFKLGTYFKIRSSTATSRFVLEQDVSAWLADPEWNFAFSELEDGAPQPPESVGTTVDVSKLNADEAQLLARESFKNELIGALQQAHAEAISNGMVITVNGIQVGTAVFQLLRSEHIVPSYKRIDLKRGEHVVSVHVYAGLGPREKADGGWYIFCNGRQVLGADQTRTTGWQSTIELDEEEEAVETGGAEKLPQYHADYARFRGFVFFHCRDAGLLPWTTTKTGVDEDSATFRLARREMMLAMRPITRFLRDVADEKSANAVDPTEPTPLNDALSAAEEITYKSLTESPFVSPEVSRRARTKRDVISIQYSRPREKVEKVMKRLRVASASRAGEQTFEFFYQAEFE